MSRYDNWSFEEWYDEVLAVAQSWSLRPSEVDAISHSWFESCWRQGWRPEEALIAALQDVGMMDEEGRIY